MKPNRRIRIAVRSTLIVCLALPCFTTARPQTAPDHALPVDPPTSKDTLIVPAARKLAPDFQLTDNTGHSFRLSQQRGKVVVLNFWATWCGGCKFELPYFVEYDHKYRQQGLSTLGISMDDGGFKVVGPFWQQKQMPYPTVIGNDGLGKQLGLSGMPYTLLIDRQGRIAIRHAGVLDKADFDHHIQELLHG